MEKVENGCLVVRYTAISGEAEFSCVTLIPYKGEKHQGRVVAEYFQDFFGPETVQEGEYTFFSNDLTQAVRVNGWAVASPEDHAVLRKYI